MSLLHHHHHHPGNRVLLVSLLTTGWKGAYLPSPPHRPDTGVRWEWTIRTRTLFSCLCGLWQRGGGGSDLLGGRGEGEDAHLTYSGKRRGGSAGVFHVPLAANALGHVLLCRVPSGDRVQDAICSGEKRRDTSLRACVAKMQSAEERSAGIRANGHASAELAAHVCCPQGDQMTPRA